MNKHKRALLALRQGPDDRRSALDLLEDLIECRGEERKRTIADLRAELADTERGASVINKAHDSLAIELREARRHLREAQAENQRILRGSDCGSGEADVCLLDGQGCRWHAPRRAEKQRDAGTRRGANWTQPVVRAACFVGLGDDGETCLACGQHISQHFGGTEYRCQPQDEEDAAARAFTAGERAADALAATIEAAEIDVRAARQEAEHLRALIVRLRDPRKDTGRDGPMLCYRDGSWRCWFCDGPRVGPKERKNDRHTDDCAWQQSSWPAQGGTPA